MLPLLSQWTKCKLQIKVAAGPYFDKNRTVLSFELLA